MKRFTTVPLCRGLGEKEEGWEKAHLLTLFYLQTVFTFYLHIADQASDLSVQNPMTTTYLTGHLTSVSNVPAPRWCPAELEQKPIFKHPCILRMIVCILLCVRVRSVAKCFQLFATPWTVPMRLLCPWIPQAKILQWVAISSSRGIFLTQGSNQSLLSLRQWQADSLPLSHLGSPGIQ